MSHVTIDDMKKLQNDYFNVSAEAARPALLKYVKENELNAAAKKYVDIFRNWNLEAAPGETGQTIYQTWWDSLEVVVWRDEMETMNPTRQQVSGKVRISI